mgnify:FL=1
MENKKIANKYSILLKIIISILTIIILLGISIYTYDRLTVNNEYLISEKNLEIPIFLYHHIVKEESEIQYDYMQTTEKTFEEQIRGLENLGYHFISYQDLIDYNNGQKKLYKKSCVLTFDDGCRDIYTNAYPILQKYNIPFTMFVVTNAVGADGCASWEELKEMQDSGLALIASHSTNHTEFNKLSVEETLENVDSSYKALEENLGEQKTKIFTYPYGLYSQEQLEPLKEEGYVINLTDNKINKSKDLNLYGLHRCYPLSDSLFKMELKIIYRSIRY